MRRAAAARSAGGGRSAAEIAVLRFRRRFMMAIMNLIP